MPPHRTPSAISSAGPRSAASSCPSSSSGTAPRWPAPPAPPWASRPSPPSAGPCSAAPNGTPPRRPWRPLSHSGPAPPTHPPSHGGIRSRAAAQGGARPPTRAPGSPLTPGRPRGRTGAVAGPAGIRRSTDRFPRTRPHVFGQLPSHVHAPPEDPSTARSTCTERVWRGARTLWGPATGTRRTSLHGPRVQRFVIECFTPSCHVDNLPDGEPATPAPHDTVDSIMTVLRRGTRAGPRGNVLERQTRSMEGAATTEGGLAV
jgi:hypothetical protein